MITLTSKVTAALALASIVMGLGHSAKGATYYVDGNYAGVDGAAFGSYTAAYKTINAALAAVPAGASAANPNKVFFAPGVYDTAKTTGVSLQYSRANVALIGLSGNPNDVVITSFLDSAYNPGSGALGTTGSASLQLKGNNQTAAFITFANSTNTPYIVNTGHKAVTPTGDYVSGTTAQTANQPAVALLLQGDEQGFYNDRFLGYQDTLYTKGGRAYFQNCYVSGDIDFIFANGTSVFDHSTINFDGDHSGGTITAPSTDKRQSNGMVFLNSTITGNSVKGDPNIDPQNAANASGPAANSMNLGRPWGWQQVGGDAGTVFVNTKMTPAVKSTGWLTWNANETNVANGKQDGNPAKDSRFAEYNSMDLLGSPLDVSGRVAWSKQLTASQAAAYTVPNLFSSESGYGWFGQGYTPGDATPGTGSANPSDPNYSWPAFWGDRNSNNDTANATVSAVYPLPGNPAAYSNPNWTLGGNWNPQAQFATIGVPEPSTIVLAGIGLAALAFARRRSLRRPCVGKMAVLAVIVLTWFAASSAHAASIWNVDFIGANAMSGAAAVGSAGDFWNTAEQTDLDNNLTIKDTTGVSGPSNITLNFTAPAGTLFGFNADGTANPAALMDGIGSNANPGSGTSASGKTFTFSGLAANSAYTIYAYAASQTGTDRGTSFFQTIGGPVLGFTSGASTNIVGGLGLAYTTFSMTSNGSGAITILSNFHSSTSAQAPVNGFQIVGAAPVPEPASICLLAAGGLMVFAARKRLSAAC